MKKRFKYRFYPSCEQREMLIRTFGVSRYAYNWCLDLRTKAYTIDKIKISYKESDRLFNQHKQEVGNEWMLEISSIPLQQSIRHLQSAYEQFFRGSSKYPVFKSRHDKTQSASYTTNGFTFRKAGKDAGKLFIAKSKEPLDIKWSRLLPAAPTSMTIKRNSADRWFVSFVVEVPTPSIDIPIKGVGIDLGVKTLATLSDGSTYENNKYFKKYHSKLKKAQQNLSRKAIGSKNREKARLKVAKISAKIADSRQDHIHKMTTEISNKNQVISIEDLNVNGMIKNRYLARSINDASFSMIRSQLEYKTEERSTDLIVINRFFPSSKLCSGCGSLKSELQISDRIYICDCGLILDRDLNAAKNILAAGLADRLNDCGDGRRPGGLILPESVYQAVNI